MKATVNGIVVEGTPQELAEYQKVMDTMRKEGTHIKPPLGKMPEWIKPIDNGSKCPNHGKPCYCTGECMEKPTTGLYKSLFNHSII